MNPLADVLERTLRLVGWIMVAWFLTVLALVTMWYLGGFLAR